jgi:hypothetical protein
MDEGSHFGGLAASPALPLFGGILQIGYRLIDEWAMAILAVSSVLPRTNPLKTGPPTTVRFNFLQCKNLLAGALQSRPPKPSRVSRRMNATA